MKFIFNTYKKKLNSKNNIFYFVAVFLIILLIVSTDMKFLFERYVEKNYPEIKISNEQFLEYGDKLKDFENRNGRLHSTSSDPMVTYNPENINFDNIVSIKINVKYLSDETAQSQLYIMDSYKCINYELRQGANEIFIPKGINDGKPIKGFRFDLLTKDNLDIEIDSIIFNDSDSIIKNVFVKEYQQVLAKIMILFVICITPILTFQLGLRRTRLNKHALILYIGSFAGMATLYKFKYVNNIFYFICLSIFGLLTGLLGYYFITKSNIYIYKKIKKKINISFEVFLVTTFMFCCFAIYSKLGNVYIYIAFYPFYLFGFFYNKFKIVKNKNNLKIIIILLLSVVILSKFIFNLNDVSMLLNSFNTSYIKLSIIFMTLMSWLVGFSLLSIKNIRTEIRGKNIFKIFEIYIFFIIFIVSIILYTKINSIVYISIFSLILITFKKNRFLSYYESNDHNYKENSLVEICLGKRIDELFRNLCIIFIVTIFFESLIKIFFDKYQISDIINFIFQYVFTPNCLYNLILFTIIYYLFLCMFGNNFGKVFLILIGIVLCIGNYIKLRFQDALLKPADFWQIKTLVSTSKSFLNEYIIISFILVIVGISTFIIRYRQKMGLWLKPSPNILMSMLVIISLMFFDNCLENGKFSDVNISSGTEWSGDKFRIENEGFFIYNYSNFKAIDKIKVSKPGNYSQQTMNKLKDEIQTLPKNPMDNTKPNIILVMEESMFDIQKINEIHISKNINSNIKEYEKGTIISPRYGGGTASVEFEALTGFSNIFFADNVIQYVTYWNSKDNIPSIAQEFNKNGYTTTAIHPNEANVYNRNQVYSAMGFNKFLSIEDFINHKATNSRGYILDSEVKSVIQKQLNSTNDPQFIFAVTIENHTPYNSKGGENDIKIASDKLSDSEISEAEAYSEGLSDNDKFVAQIVETVKNSNRPTIVYVWGDHLPALASLDTLGFLEDQYNKYSTPLVAYSNFKDINLENEYMTPNQIATQIIQDSGISHSSYFDYIYSLRNSYPIMHKEFGVDMNNEKIKKYELLQYDLLFGDKHILN